jgi:two-component system, OmpR family, response regulator ResD
MSKKRILCVDDHHDMCELVSTVLKKYEVSNAHSMEDALRQATLEQFNLFLLDYHLPDGTGIELCLLIKNFDTETPILFVTGTSSMTKAQAETVGAQGLIKKGSAKFVEELEKKVDELCQRVS